MVRRKDKRDGGTDIWSVGKAKRTVGQKDGL